MISNNIFLILFSKKLQDHSLKVRKTCDTCEKMSHIYLVYYSFLVSIPVNHSEKMSYFSLSLLLYSCLEGLFHTLQVQNMAKITPKNIVKYCTKNAFAIFFGILKKHVIPAVRYIPRFPYLRAAPDPVIT